MTPRIFVIIPALNEEVSIGKVIADIPGGLVSEVIVTDNGSADGTADIAAAAGATVLREERRGYGYACMKGIEYARSKAEGERPDIVVFLDGDYSDYPEELPILVKPIIEDGYDMIIGSRTRGERERGALLPQAFFGNALATTLIKWIYGVEFTDLGPFRAIRFDKLLLLGMTDMTYGWTVEMQIKAAKQGLRCGEVPASYRKRIGESKVTGTLGGTVMAGYKILFTIFKHIW
ncbi:MAG TPA: glycosyltransferase family 2 protein [Thermodesulfobacteriota bacterium]|nr:glycosyltransferase family 2 protein [Thermodesulfobacteriota bacterium]